MMTESEEHSNRVERRRRSVWLSRIDRFLGFTPENPNMLVQLWHVAQLIVIAARQAQIPRMAAALSFRTIFGLIPVIVVGISVYANFAPDHAGDAVRRLLKFTNISEIQVADESAFFDSGTDVGAAAPAESDFGRTSAGGKDHGGSEALPAPKLTNAEKQRLDVWIEGLVGRAKTIQFGAISIVGLITLIYAALSMLVEIEKGFNHLYMAPAGRSWTRRVPLYWTLLTLGNIGLIASFWVQSKVVGFVEAAPGLGSLPLGALPAKIATYVLTVVISTSVLFVIYMTVPNTRVRRNAALIGAFIAAVLWEAGKWGFAKYLSFSLNYAKLYGSIAILPLFLLWVYTTWIIVLIGLQISHSLQTYTLAKVKGLSDSVLATLGLMDSGPDRSRAAIVDAGAILAVASAVARRFETGNSSDHVSIAQATRLDESVVARMLERLAERGYLHRLATGDQEGNYTMARPPESISANEIVLVGESMAEGDLRGANPALDVIAQARASVLAGRTLADIAGLKPGTGSNAGDQTNPGAVTDASKRTIVSGQPATSPA